MIPPTPQPENPPASNLHSKDEPGSFEEYVKVADELLLGSGGLVPSDVSGGVVSARELSTVQEKAVGAACYVPGRINRPHFEFVCTVGEFRVSLGLGVAGGEAGLDRDQPALEFRAAIGRAVPERGGRPGSGRWDGLVMFVVGAVWSTVQV